MSSDLFAIRRTDRVAVLTVDRELAERLDGDPRSCGVVRSRLIAGCRR